MKPCTFYKALLACLLALVGLLGSSTASAQVCTREYAPVCAQVAGEPTLRTFANGCLMDAAKATLVAQGECAAKPTPMVGGDTDAHGCKGSAGYLWNAELQQCVRPWMSSAITLEVAPKRQTCMGVIEMQCLMVRERIPGQAPPKWAPFFGSIGGFTFVPGQRYTLRVRKDKLDNPPADAPDTTYTLLKVLP
jgi:hypothetical protein